MSNTVLSAQDYKNIVGLMEAIPKSYQSNLKHSYTVFQRFFEIAHKANVLPYSPEVRDSTKLQKLVEGVIPETGSVPWDSPSNNYSSIPALDLVKIQDHISAITYGFIVSPKEVKILHNYLLKHKAFNLYHFIQKGYMEQPLDSNLQAHVLGLFTGALKDGLIKMEEFNKPLWKKIIEYNSTRGDKYLAKDMLTLFTKILVNNKGSSYFESDWIVENINKFFNSQKTINKSTTKSLHEFVSSLKDLNLDKYKVSQYLVKYLNNSSPIKEQRPEAYHWEVDLNHLSNNEKIGVKKLKDNLDSMLGFLNSEKHSISGVINLHSQRSKNIVSIFVIYKEEESVEDIRALINKTVESSRQNIEVDLEAAKKSWNMIRLHSKLSNSLEDGKTVVSKKRKL